MPEREPSNRIHIEPGGDANIAGDVVGRDKITTTVVGYTVEQVSGLLDQLRTHFQPKPFDGRCPYKGLDAFELEDSELFFGREALVQEILGRLQTARCLFIAGASGSGKSSLIRAGLLSALDHGALPGSDRWKCRVLTPGRKPLESLALATAALADSLAAADEIRQRGLADPTILRQRLEMTLGPARDRRAVLVVDQFEEIFSPLRDPAERTAFLDLLIEAATGEGGRLHLIFVIRSDFVSRCSDHPRLNALLNEQFMQVGPMQPDELVSAIASPALRAGLRIDPDLVATMVRDVRDDSGSLPLMQFALKDLFDAQQAHGGVAALTLEDYLARGGLHQALARHAERVFSRLTDDEQRLARGVFSGLVEIGQGPAVTRRITQIAELIPAGQDPSPFNAVVQRLAEARLVTIGDTAHGARSITLVHEKLLDAWPWLRRLVAENRETIDLQNQIAEDAQEWAGHDEDSSYLYTGARLATAQERLEQRALALGELSQKFLTVSIAAETAERQRELARQQKELDDARRLAESETRRAAEQSANLTRLRLRNRVITASLVVALMLAAAAIFYFVQAEGNARTAQENEVIARSRQLAAQAAAQQSEHYDLSALLSLEALRSGNTHEARSVLLRGLLEHPWLEAFLTGHAGPVTALAFRSDGRLLASASRDGTVRLWDVVARQPVGAPLTGHTSPILSLALSSDGQWLASGGSDNRIFVWNIADPQRPLTGTVLSLGSSVLSLAFSPTGPTLAAGGQTSDISLWRDPTTSDGSDQGISLQAPLSGLVRIGEPVVGLTFSADGQVLISASSTSLALWDVSRAEALSDSRLASIWSLARHPTGVLATGSRNGQLQLWDLRESTPLDVSLDGQTRALASIAFSPDGRWLAGAAADGSVRIWDTSDLAHPRVAAVPLLGHTGRVNAVAFSPTSDLLASAGEDGHVLLWRTPEVLNPPPQTSVAATRALGIDVSRFQGEVDWQAVKKSGIEFVFMKATQDLGRLDAAFLQNWEAARAAGLRRGAYHFFNPRLDARVQAAAFVRTFQLQPDDLPPVLDVETDGGLDAQSLLEAVETWLTELERQTGRRPILYLAAYQLSRGALRDPDGRYPDWLANYPVWIATYIPEGQRPSPERRPRLPADWPTDWAFWQFSDAGRVAGIERDVDLNVFNGTLDELITFLQRSPAPTRPWNDPAMVFNGAQLSQAHQTPAVSSLAVSPDGRWFATGGPNYTVTLQDWETHQAQVLLSQTAAGAATVAFTPDSRMLVANDGPATVALWEVAKRQQVAEFTSPSGSLATLAVSPDGHWLAAGGCAEADTQSGLCRAGQVIIWDLQTRQIVGTPRRAHADTIFCLAFSPDGRHLASGAGDGMIWLWDTATWQTIGEPMRGHSNSILGLAFSHDSQQLATASQDKTIRFWEVASRRQRGQALTGHTRAVFGVAFSPDDAWLASASWDTTVRLWDVATGQLVGLPLRGHRDIVNAVAFSPDGHTLASGSWDNTIRLWDLTLGTWSQRACDQANRDLTPRDRETYLISSADQAMCLGSAPASIQASLALTTPLAVPTSDRSPTVSLPTATSLPAASPEVAGDPDPVLEAVYEIVARTLGVDPQKVHADSRLRSDLEADELDIIEVVIAVEDHFGLEISDGDYEVIMTVGDLARLVRAAETETSTP